MGKNINNCGKTCKQRQEDMELREEYLKSLPCKSSKCNKKLGGFCSYCDKTFPPKDLLEVPGK